MRSGSRAGEGGLGSGRQSVAHGVVAAVTDVRGVDGGEVAVGLGAVYNGPQENPSRSG